MSAADVFELTHPLPSREWLLLEASAGTGKTYSLTALVARYVAEEGLRADELLMVTFTRAAAAEMKQEVREQLLRALNAVNAPDSEKLDPWLANLRDCTFPALGAPIAVGLKAEELQEVDALGSVVTDIRVHIVPHEFKLVYIKSLDKIHQVCPKVVICRKRY